MLRKTNRFSFRKGVPKKVLQTPFFVLRYDVSPDKILHLAVVVSKKVDKRAVGRNKLKRKIVSFVQALVSIETQKNIVIFVKKQILEINDEQIKLELEKALNQSN